MKEFFDYIREPNDETLKALALKNLEKDLDFFEE